jgi:hypothetical protein
MPEQLTEYLQAMATAADANEFGIEPLIARRSASATLQGAAFASHRALTCVGLGKKITSSCTV